MTRTLTLVQYRAMLLARQRSLLEGDPHGGFRGLPQSEIDGRLAELRNALNMLDSIETDPPGRAPVD